LLHNHAKLPDKELISYQEYNTILEDLNYQVEQLKDYKVDTLDIELELKLTSAKIKQGQFNLADIYLESLNPKLSSEWTKLGKKPLKLETRKLNKEEIMKNVAKAIEERKKYSSKEEKLDDFKQLEVNLRTLKKKLEEIKSTGINTSLIEIKLKELEKQNKRVLETKNKLDLDEAKKMLKTIQDELAKSTK